MSSVIYQEGFAGEAPVFFFEYGILELSAGEPSEGVNLEAQIRSALMQKGMQTVINKEHIPVLDIKATVEGDRLLIPWIDDEPDEMQMSKPWLAAARSFGRFIAIYLNLRPDDLSFKELVSIGALMGIINLHE
jgi:hypothetical protein